MISLRTFSMTFACVFVFTGCESEGPNEQFPKREAREAIAVALPAFAELSSLDFVAIQQTGDEINPSFRARFEGEITLREDTYEIDGRDANVIFLRLVSKRNDKRKAYGVISLKYKAGSWVGKPNFDRQPLEGAGQPRDFLSQGKQNIVRGSSEEEEYIKELEALAREQEQREAEQAKAREKARKERESKISKCTFDSLAGVYGAQWGDLSCSISGELLTCCYSANCMKRIELTRSADKQRLTGKWFEKGSGPAIFPISEDCEITSGLYGQREGSAATKSWNVTGKKQ